MQMTLQDLKFVYGRFPATFLPIHLSLTVPQHVAAATYFEMLEEFLNKTQISK
jgi:hypothetical protein